MTGGRRLWWPLLGLALAACGTPPRDPLPSWSDGAVKQAIVAFVSGAARAGSPGFIPPAERVAVFDNDGTLWAEQPFYFQVAFALDRARAIGPGDSTWQARPALRAAAAGDRAALAAAGEGGLAEVVFATHAGMTVEQFAAAVRAWLDTARHARFQRPYTDLVYQPMLELLAYLRAGGFRTYIVSAGGEDFMRVWADSVYGIPPEQVIGSTLAIELETRGGVPTLVRRPRIDFIDDGPAKPVAIARAIGRRPVFAFGNSDGDHEMLQWTAAGSGPRFLGLVHHTDSVREWAYDRASRVGRLDAALDDARARGWTVVDMRRDWRNVFRFETP